MTSFVRRLVLGGPADRPSYTSTHESRQTGSEGEDQPNDDFLSFFKRFVSDGGLDAVFPSDDDRDTAVQFELISTIDLKTVIGKAVSVTVRNTPADRQTTSPMVPMS
ncbi:Type II secretion system (T2SS)-associated protein Gcp15 [Andalucia godoyi]|uniref:Type II secretion system (T2SS)-associated protein Gcp15 n=1 Tax=Andalucia godoyi TaxID=505711 RepID=A0A8K0AK12_ANDGO|nr:Type II secretion system (T2SS)-associated protein Gcp15 [Andalucia godoyi]|eukprot:ANDGO_04095.mRNA.1 Type II secretion system (T2SS)-associated protein Gcp15